MDKLCVARIRASSIFKAESVRPMSFDSSLAWTGRDGGCYGSEPMLPDIVEMEALAATFHVNRRRRCLLRIPVYQVFPTAAEEKLDRFHGRHDRDAVDPRRLSKPI